MPPVAQGTGVVGGDRLTEILLSALTPTMVGLVWAKPLLAVPQWLINQVPNPQKEELKMHRPVCRVECRASGNALGAKVGAIWPKSVQPQSPS